MGSFERSENPQGSWPRLRSAWPRVFHRGFGVGGRLLLLFAFILTSLAIGAQVSRAAEEEKPLKIEYRFTPPAPREQGDAAVAAKSEGCYSCHTRTDQPSMHATPAVKLGCTDCHGGDSTSPAAFGKPELGYKSPYNRSE